MKKHFHFVGIGGIGMSAIARILHAHGYTISGCDSNINQDTITQLKNLGCTIFTQSNTHACPLKQVETIVYSTAIAKNNPDIMYAQDSNIALKHRSEILGEIMHDAYSIAITGSHGKTTTTSILGHLLLQTGYNPTIVSGGIINNIKSNAYVGDKNFVIAEADESDRSFLNLHPNITLITNIDFEHAETYKDIDDILTTYEAFATKVFQKDFSTLIFNGDDTHCKKLLKKRWINRRTITYGFEEDNNIIIYDYTLHPKHSTFRLYGFPDTLFNVPMAGKHNIANAAAAIVVWSDINNLNGLKPSYNMMQRKIMLSNALKTFSGIDRRFSIRGTYNDATIVDDYAHHPVEIAKTIETARAQTKGKLIVVFQPHRYSRTKALWDQFVDVLQNAPCDQMIITDIYPASEDPIENITSHKLVDACNASHILYQSNIDILQDMLATICQPDDMILFLGAGNIYHVGLKLTKLLFSTPKPLQKIP